MNVIQSHAVDPDQWDEMRDVFRCAVLEATDPAMNRVFERLGKPARYNDTGAQDRDLPELFKALDALFARNMARNGFGCSEG